MTADEILHLFKLMLSYLPPTLKLFGFTLLYSIPLGMVVALLKMCKFKPVSWLTNLYILIMRGTPLLLQIIVVYYSVPTIRSNPHCPAFLQNLLNGVELRGDAGVVYMFRMILLAFVLNYAAYFAEIFRGGIESIPKGQYEAAAMLGFSKLQTHSAAGGKARNSCVLKRSHNARKGHFTRLLNGLHGSHVHSEKADDDFQFAHSAFHGRSFLLCNGNDSDYDLRSCREKAELLQIGGVTWKTYWR